LADTHNKLIEFWQEDVNEEEGNRVRGTVRTIFLISTVVMYLVNRSFFSRLIYASSSREVQVDIKGRTRTIPETLVRQAQVHDEVDRPYNVCDVSRQLHVSKPLTTAVVHVCCFDFGGCAEEVCQLHHCPVVRLFDTRLYSTRVDIVTKGTKLTFCSHMSRMERRE
jgi:hypothetical protein